MLELPGRKVSLEKVHRIKQRRRQLLGQIASLDYELLQITGNLETTIKEKHPVAGTFQRAIWDAIPPDGSHIQIGGIVTLMGLDASSRDVRGRVSRHLSHMVKRFPSVTRVGRSLYSRNSI